MKLKKLSTLLMVPALAVALAACGGSDKPSKEEVTKGMTKTVQDELGAQTTGLTDEQMNQLISCMVDETYDKVSTETLRALADGKEPTASSDSDDAKAFNDATTTCSQKMIEDLVG